MSSRTTAGTCSAFPATSGRFQVDLLRSLRHGVQAGAVAGLLTGGFGYLLAEPVMDRAVRLEAAREAADRARQVAAGLTVTRHAEVFSRSTQHVGLLVATLATGVALGVLLSVVHAVVHRFEKVPDAWRSSLRLAASAFFAVYLVPFLRYPANPPGVGDPSTVDTRTRAYLAALTIGVAGVVAAARLGKDLRRRRVVEPVRQLAVAGVLIGTVALTFLLPADADPLEVPAGLLWQFRLLALASSLLLWAGLGAAFGLLERTGRSAHPGPGPRLLPVR